MLAKNEKGSRAAEPQPESAPGEEHTARAATATAATGRHSLWPPSAMQMICRGRLQPTLPSLALPARNVPALATCWVAVRQKLKPNNDFQSKQQLGPARQRGDASSTSASSSEGIAQFAPRNYATNACGTRSSQLAAIAVANFIT